MNRHPSCPAGLLKVHLFMLEGYVITPKLILDSEFSKIIVRLEAFSVMVFGQ